MTYWRSQAVEMHVLPDIPPPVVRAPRACRTHQRLEWDERLRRNARGTQIIAQIHVAGVPNTLARIIGCSRHQ